MAKDDYYTIVAKILVFLYKKLQGKEKGSVKEYIIPMTKDFPISEEYFQYVIANTMHQNRCIVQQEGDKKWRTKE